MARPPRKKTPRRARPKSAKPATQGATPPAPKTGEPVTPKPRPTPTPRPRPNPTPTPTPTPPIPDPAPTPEPVPPPKRPTPDPRPTPTPAALSMEDVKLIRAALDAFQPGGVVVGTTPTDQVVAMMAERLAKARAEDAARIAALEAKVAELDKTIASASDDRDAELRDALDATDALLAEVARLTASSDTGSAALATAQDQLARATREVSELRASADPKATGAHVLGAETVASLLNEFVGSFKDRFGGLQVSSGDVLLKAGFAQLGQGAGFVLPTANAPPGEQPVLHDIRLRLDPKGGAGPA